MDRRSLIFDTSSRRLGNAPEYGDSMNAWLGPSLSSHHPIKVQSSDKLFNVAGRVHGVRLSKRMIFDEEYGVSVHIRT